MNETIQTHFGHISHYNNERHFGFIDTEDGESIFFFFDNSVQIKLKKSGAIDRIHKFYSGDEVEFKLRPSLKDNGNVEAYDIKFIRNLRRQKLVDEAKEKGVLRGYLKLIDEDKLFVKHLTTYVFIPIKISEWEVDLNSVYTVRIDKLVEFKLTQTAKLDKLSANLTDRKFSKEYEMILDLIEKGQATEARITGRNSQGLFATVFNGTMEGFITLSKDATANEQNKFQQLRQGSSTLVNIKHLSENKKLSLKLADSSNISL